LNIDVATVDTLVVAHHWTRVHSCGSDSEGRRPALCCLRPTRPDLTGDAGPPAFGVPIIMTVPAPEFRGNAATRPRGAPPGRPAAGEGFGEAAAAVAAAALAAAAAAAAAAAGLCPTSLPGLWPPVTGARGLLE